MERGFPVSASPEYIASRCEVLENGCWLWMLARNSDGYGQAARTRAHRVSYVVHVGPIPSGMTIDHICHTAECRLGRDCPHRACVNPAHLRPVSLAENISRTGNQHRTHCPVGHAYTEENTFRGRDGRRCCRECGRARQRVGPRPLRTHCPQGHLFDEANTRYRTGTKTRICITCQRAACRRSYHKRKAVA